MTEPQETERGAGVYTHGHHDSVLRSHRVRTIANSAAYLESWLQPGVALLDVGCGPGSITCEFAERVAPGPVVATEISEDALALGRATAAERGLSERGVPEIDFRVADVHDLPFDDDSFDVVHAHQVLQHVTDPVRALAEMRRVCRPNGVVAARDSDYAGFVWFPESSELTDWLRLYRQAAHDNHAEPDAGRRLLSWAQQAGFSEITPSASVWSYATPESRAWWGGLWADRILQSSLTRQLLDAGQATQADLDAISAAWLAWAAAPDGWFLIPHGEILARP